MKIVLCICNLVAVILSAFRFFLTLSSKCAAVSWGQARWVCLLDSPSSHFVVIAFNLPQRLSCRHASKRSVKIKAGIAMEDMLCICMQGCTDIFAWRCSHAHACRQHTLKIHRDGLTRWNCLLLAERAWRPLSSLRCTEVSGHKYRPSHSHI